MEVDIGLSRMRRTFRDLTPTPRDLDGMTDHHGATVFQLEWRRKGTCFGDLNADFYTLLGHFAERTQFVHQSITDSGVIYDVLLGMVEPPHSHRLRFHISGDGMQHITEPAH